MNSEDYVLKHDYGYGAEPELVALHKLELRDIVDLEVYTKDVIENLLITIEKGNIMRFLPSMEKFEISIVKED